MRYSTTSPGEVAVFGFFALLFVLGVGGWVANIFKLVGMDWDAALGIEGVLRIVGIVIAPLGVIMGLFV